MQGKQEAIWQASNYRSPTQQRVTCSCYTGIITARFSPSFPCDRYNPEYGPSLPRCFLISSNSNVIASHKSPPFPPPVTTHELEKSSLDQLPVPVKHHQRIKTQNAEGN
ncbi:hypothetical protein AB1N83_007258 [Pleurotus pulmonarius]